MDDKSIVGWLLEAQTPSIRYLTLRNLLGAPGSSLEAQAIRKEMQDNGPIPAILAGQTEAGNWEGEHSHYTPKYTSTHWSMLTLTELAADGSDERMRRGANFMLADTREELESKADKGVVGWTCFYGNMLRYVLYCGFEQDARTNAVIKDLGRDALAGEWRCPYNDDRPCAWGAARALWGLAAIPDSKRTSRVKEAINSGLQFLLEEHSLVGADYPAPEGGKVHSMWGRLNFPLFYQADILFVLRVVAELGELGHPGVRAGLEWLAARRGKNGRWRGASPYRQRTWRELGGSAETNRWVSLQAARVLNH